MKQLLEALKSARKIEILVIIAMLCVLLVLGIGEIGRESVSGSETEMRMSGILSEIEGAGRVSVMLAGPEEAPTGCVIAAEGAADVRVTLELQRAARALTGLELDRIEIVQAKR